MPLALEGLYVGKDINKIIKRCRKKQKKWAEHMKAQGWHSCPVCKAVPIIKEQKICAQCEFKRRQRNGK